MGGYIKSARHTRLKLAGLLATALAFSLATPAWSATLIVVQADGSATVRGDDGETIVLPAEAVAALEAGLAEQTDPTVVQQVVADVVRQHASSDGLVAGAIAAFALSLVPEDLAIAVIAGAQAGNPDASDAIAVAAGPAPDTQSQGGLTSLSSAGGVGGGGTQEIRRSASEIR